MLPLQRSSQNVIAVSIRTHPKLPLADTREPLLCVKRGAQVLQMYGRLYP